MRFLSWEVCSEQIMLNKNVLNKLFCKFFEWQNLCVSVNFLNDARAADERPSRSYSHELNRPNYKNRIKFRYYTKGARGGVVAVPAEWSRGSKVCGAGQDDSLVLAIVCSSLLQPGKRKGRYVNNTCAREERARKGRDDDDAWIGGGKGKCI